MRQAMGQVGERAGPMSHSPGNETDETEGRGIPSGTCLTARILVSPRPVLGMASLAQVPAQRVCAQCGRGGNLLQVAVPEGPLEGVPVHRACLNAYYAATTPPPGRPDPWWSSVEDWTRWYAAHPEEATLQ
jgi:hypothetical protein